MQLVSVPTAEIDSFTKCLKRKSRKRIHAEIAKKCKSDQNEGAVNVISEITQSDRLHSALLACICFAYSALKNKHGYRTNQLESVIN